MATDNPNRTDQPTETPKPPETPDNSAPRNAAAEVGKHDLKEKLAAAGGAALAMIGTPMAMAHVDEGRLAALVDRHADNQAAHVQKVDDRTATAGKVIEVPGPNGPVRVLVPEPKNLEAPGPAKPGGGEQGRENLEKLEKFSEGMLETETSIAEDIARRKDDE